MILIGQILLGGFFLITGINHFREKQMMVAYAKKKKVPKPNTAVVLTGLMLIGGGAGVLIGLTQIVAPLLILFLVPTSFIMHNFWKEKDPEEKMHQMLFFMYNMALAGALLII